MHFMAGWPYPLTVATLFVIVMLRAGSTYARGPGRPGRGAAYAVGPLVGVGRVRSGAATVERWGAPVVTASFLTVGLQTLINLAAGVGRMPLRRYVPALVAGSVLWAFLYATVGFVTFAAWRRLYELSPVGAVSAVVVLAAALAAYVVWQVRQRRGANLEA